MSIISYRSFILDNTFSGGVFHGHFPLPHHHNTAGQGAHAARCSKGNRVLHHSRLAEGSRPQRLERRRRPNFLLPFDSQRRAHHPGLVQQIRQQHRQVSLLSYKLQYMLYMNHIHVFHE